MISTEKVLNILPIIVDVYEKTEIDNYRKTFVKENKGKEITQMDAGIELFKHIFKKISNIKQEVFEIVAIIEDKTVEEIKAQSFITTLKTLKEIFKDEEIISFFKEAMQ